MLEKTTVMTDGETLLRQGNYGDALKEFRCAIISPIDDEYRARAHQLAGECSRLIGLIDDASAYLTKGLRIAETLDDRILIGAIHRERGAVAHERGNRQDNPDDKDSHFEDADGHFYSSKTALEAELKELKAAGRSITLAERELLKTQSFRASLLYDRGFKADARSDLRHADENLRAIGGNTVDELNNLLRLMHALPFPSRLIHLPRARELTAKDTSLRGSRRRVWAALKGKPSFMQLAQ